MSKEHKNRLDQIARREHLKSFAVILLILSAVIIGFLAWLRFVNKPSDPFGRSYFAGDAISKIDISSETGVAFELVVSFKGLQQVFQSDDLNIVGQSDTTVCILQTKGARVEYNLPRPRYYSLVDPSKCRAVD